MVAVDVIEEILLRSDAKDLVLWKRVCKSWCSLISCPVFAKAHLKKKMESRNVDLRIAMPTYWRIPSESMYEGNKWKVAGSSNGLIRRLPLWPLDSECKPRGDECWGFGYDSSTDDYKVVMEIQKDTDVALIQVLSLRSNTWKLIGEFNYQFATDRPGIFFHGALHWIVFKEGKKIIISFDLAREEFKVIPQPNHPRYKWHSRRTPLLGIVDDQLCLFFLNLHNDLPREIWVMRNYNVQHSWEVLPKNYEKHEVVHHMKMAEFPSPNNKRMSFFCDDNKCLSRHWRYIGAHRLVPSLVSPHATRPSHAKNNKTSVKSWSVKHVKGEGQRSQVMVKRTIVGASKREEKEIEEIYRHEYGETANLYLHEVEIREIRSDVERRRRWREEQEKEEYEELVKSVLILE